MEILSNEQEFRFLDGMFSIGYYVAHNEGEDPFSKKLMSFKYYSSSKEKWCEIAAIELMSISMALGITFDYMIRVMKSIETVYTGNACMDIVGKYLSKENGIKYVPNSIYKKKITRPFKFLHLDERRNEIKGKYAISDKSSLENNCNILIIDDIVTTGTSVNEIVGELKKSYPESKYYLFALGRTTHNKSANTRFDMRKFDY